jgi:hypothetical protein
MDERGEMPKENINSDLDGGTRVEVSWAHDRYVQLTTAMKRTVAGSQEHPEFDTYDTGAYVSLDRYGINRLIQVLRRARNAAYGKDE